MSNLSKKKVFAPRKDPTRRARIDAERRLRSLLDAENLQMVTGGQQADSTKGLKPKYSGGYSPARAR